MSILIKKKSMKEKQVDLAFQKLLQNLNLSDAEAMEVADLYPKWQSGKTYEVGKIVKYGVNSDNETQLYTVLQEHTSQEDWKPDATTSLYKKVGFTDSGIAVWTQPLGATDAYMKGDIVSHNNSIWISTVDNNVWEPSVYGWEVKE